MAVVQRTAATVAERPVALAEAFYHHLFLLAPEVRAMFPREMTAQNEKLCRALLAAIQALVEPERYAANMERSLLRLGRDHAHRYAVLPEHYPYVGHALVRAVRDVSQDWTGDDEFGAGLGLHVDECPHARPGGVIAHQPGN